MNIRPLIASLAALALVAAPAISQQSAASNSSGPCPSDHPKVRAFVEHLVTQDWARRALALENVTDEPLRTLGDQREDHPVCVALYKKIPNTYHVRGQNAPNTAVFYRLDDRYILALTITKFSSKGQPPKAPEQFISFDLDLNRLGTVVY